jgi:hypothetical protein
LYKWQLSTTPADQVPQITPDCGTNCNAVTYGANQMTFWKTRQTSTTEQYMCKHVEAGAGVTTQPTVYVKDLRVETDSKISGTPILSRPSTSWDAMFQW